MTMTPETIENIVHTTVGDLASAFYEAALAELGNEALARQVARELTCDALRRSRHQAR
ncbi:MAG: hypothetical protein ACO3JL_18360 [Myxococcota bacterium]